MTAGKRGSTDLPAGNSLNAPPLPGPSTRTSLPSSFVLPPATCTTLTSSSTGQINLCPCLAPSQSCNSATLELILPELIRLPVCFGSSSNSSATETVALLDHGATLNIVSQQLLRQLKIADARISREHRLVVQVADNRRVETLGSISLTYRIGRLSFTDTFHILPNCSQPLIFSLQWIHAHNAVYHPKTREVYVDRKSSAKPVCLPSLHQIPYDNSVLAVTTLSLTDAHALRAAHPDDEWFLVQCMAIAPDSSSASTTDPLTGNPARLAADLCTEYADILVDDLPTNLKLNRSFEAEIHLKPGTLPINSRPYRVPLHLEGELKATIEYMLEHDIIEPSSSEFGFPVLFSRRPNDPRSPLDPKSYRFCCDLRRLNQVVLNQPKVSTPTVDEMLERLADIVRQGQAARRPNTQLCVTTLDCIKSFWQLLVRASDRKYVAFVTPIGRFQYKRLPFGFVTATSIFQEFIQQVLHDLPAAFAYIDDIVIGTYSTWEEHADHVRAVLDRCRQNQLFLKKSKAQFFRTSVDFLGHHVSAEGVTTQTAKTAAISAWPTPTTAKHVKMFLGLASYYRKFIRNFSMIAAPLTDLLRKGVAFSWTVECQQAFDSLKAALTSQPILHHFDPTLPTEVHCDASNVGIGGVLLQQPAQGSACVVGFYSRKLTPTEQRYHATERELLAIKDTLLFFRFYLLGIAFKVFTDHQALTYFQTQKELSSRLIRWLQTLSEFAITEFRYVKGSENIVPDALSRQDEVPLPALSTDAPHHEQLIRPEDGYLLAFTVSTLEPLTEAIRAAYPDCAFSQNIIRRLQSKTVVPRYHLDDGLLFYTDSLRRVRLCIPQALRREVLQRAHDLQSHLGFSRTYLQLAATVYWPQLRKDTELYILSCTHCLQGKSYRQKQMGNPHSHAVPANRFEVVSLDLLTGLPRTSDKNDSILLFIDEFTGRVYLTPCRKTITSELAAQKFIETVFRSQGLPKVLISDNAAIFTSKFWNALFKMLNVHVKHSSPFMPQSNGRPERMNSVVLEALRIYCNQYPRADWDKYLPILETHLNAAVRRPTGLSPFEVMFGKPIRTQLTLPAAADHQEETLDSIIEASEVSAQAARDALEHAARATEDRLALARRPCRYQVGDMVWLSTANLNLPDASAKLNPRFVGPFRILEFVSDNTVRLEVSSRFASIRNTVINIKWLRPHVDRDPAYMSPDLPPDPLVTRDGLEYEIENILSKRRRGRGIQYLVKWTGYNQASESTWLPAHLLQRKTGLRELIRQFEARQEFQALPTSALPPSDSSDSDN